MIGEVCVLTPIGWRDFSGRYRNQGACVSAVQRQLAGQVTGGRPA